VGGDGRKDILREQQYVHPTYPCSEDTAETQLTFEATAERQSSALLLNRSTGVKTIGNESSTNCVEEAGDSYRQVESAIQTVTDMSVTHMQHSDHHGSGSRNEQPEDGEIEDSVTEKEAVQEEVAPYVERTTPLGLDNGTNDRTSEKGSPT
jgi:hypothetical protein